MSEKISLDSSESIYNIKFNIPILIYLFTTNTFNQIFFR